MTNFENFFTFAPDISSNTFAAKQDSDLTSFWVTTYLFSFILRETCVSTKVNCSCGVSKFKPSGQNYFTFRGKTITKHEQIWNLSSDWVWIWVRRNCTLLLRQSIPKLLFCRAASTFYLLLRARDWHLNQSGFSSHWYDLLQNLRMNWLLFTVTH